MRITRMRSDTETYTHKCICTPHPFCIPSSKSQEVASHCWWPRGFLKHCVAHRYTGHHWISLKDTIHWHWLLKKVLLKMNHMFIVLLFIASWICSRFPAVMLEIVQQLSFRIAWCRGLPEQKMRVSESLGNNEYGEYGSVWCIVIFPIDPIESNKN